MAENGTKYKKSSLTREMAAEYSRRLKRSMEEDKPYLDPNLTLAKLASKLSIRPHHLSQVLNEQMNESFFALVNRHRLREAKERLRDPELSHYSILGIAKQVGFRSKSVFNTKFLQETGMTPSEFRKQNQ